MPGKLSSITKKLAVLIAAIVAFGAIVWVGMRVFEPVSVPPPIAAKAHVTFDPKTDIRSNPLFDTLRLFVAGDIQAGALGKAFPFLRDGQGAIPGQAGSRLASAEELLLSGAVARDLARSSSGEMLILLSGVGGDGTISYEIRSYPFGFEPETFASWTAPSRPDTRVVRIAQDRQDRVWLLNEEGGVGYIFAGGSPVWPQGLQTGLSGGSLIAVDGADRIWVTDGTNVSIGGEREFTLMNIAESMREMDRIAFNQQLTDASSDIRPEPLSGPEGLLRAGLLPESFRMLSDGRIALVTGYTVLAFPLSLQTPPDWTDLLSAGISPLTVGPNGDVWGVERETGGLARIWATGTRSYADEASSPEDVKQNPDLFASFDATLYTLDYSTAAPFLWSTQGEHWSAKVVVASGTLPEDMPRRIAVDAMGDVWALMSQGGVVHITNGTVSP